MRAANEIPAAERLQPSQTMDHHDYEKACEQLHQVDHRIPPDVIKKAVQLFFSTHLLPDYDLTNSHVRELPATNMLALILPLPDTSHFSDATSLSQTSEPHMGATSWDVTSYASHLSANPP